MAQEMYKLNPYYITSENHDTPDCMYKLNRIYAQANKQVSSTEEKVSPEIVALEQRQEDILQRLEALKLEVEKLSQKHTTTNSGRSSRTVLPATPASVLSPGGVIQDIVINASPNSPPLYLLVLQELLSTQYKVLTSSFVHSSVASVPTCLKSLFSDNGVVICRTDYQLALTLIWKADKYGTSMMLSPNAQTPIYGDANIARYLARLINPAYDNTDIVSATQIDTWLDQATQLITGTNKERAGVLRSLNAKLGKGSWIVGSELSLADIMLWSALQQNKMTQAVPGNVKKWLELCNEQEIFHSSLRIAGQL